MCKTYDCMGISLAIVVSIEPLFSNTRSITFITDILSLTFIDCVVVIVWKLLLQLLLPVLLAPRLQRVVVADHGAAPHQVGHSLVPHLQLPMPHESHCTLESCMGKPWEHTKD